MKKTARKKSMIHAQTLIVVVSVAIGILFAIELRIHAGSSSLIKGAGLGLCLGIVAGLVTIDICEVCKHATQEETTHVVEVDQGAGND